MVELQHLLWLYRPVLGRQTPLQLSQVKVAPGSVDGECALCCLYSILSSHWLSYNSLRSRSIHYELQPLPLSLLDRCSLPSCLFCTSPCIVGQAIVQVCYHSKRRVGCSDRGSASSRWLIVREFSLSTNPNSTFLFCWGGGVHGGVVDGARDVIPPPSSALPAGQFFEGILVGVDDGHTQVCLSGVGARLTLLL